MGGKKRRKPAASETPWDGVDAAKLTPAQLLVRDGHRSIYDFRHEAFGGDVDFFNGYPRDACPFCGGEVVRFGHEQVGAAALPLQVVPQDIEPCHRDHIRRQEAAAAGLD